MGGGFAPELDALPAPAEKPVKLEVSASAESSLRRGHPWLYAERIQAQSREASAGDLAVVFDRKRRFLAVGLYDPHARLRMRVLRARKPGPVDGSLFRERIAAAVARRQSLPGTGTDGYRLIHGESDGMSGFVADRYDATAVVKLYSHAWLPHLGSCVRAIVDALPGLERVVLRTSRQLSAVPRAMHGLRDGQVIWGDPPAAAETLVFRENGLRFEVDPVRGQKTGFFLDQRDNRSRVERLAGGARVLNAFAYSGGFSVYAARGGAREVLSLDQSRPALASAQRNFALNEDLPSVAKARHETLAGDAFQSMADLAAGGRNFDLVVVDPPSFASRRSHVDDALRSYARLTHLALRVLAPDAKLVLASCSSRVTPEAFRRAVCDAATRAGRPLRIRKETGHALDHPLDFAEGRYLSCLFSEA